MSETLRIDLLRCLYGGRETVESLRGTAGADFDVLLAQARAMGEIVDAGTGSSGAKVTAMLALSPGAREALAASLEDASPSFLDPSKDGCRSQVRSGA